MALLLCHCFCPRLKLVGAVCACVCVQGLRGLAAVVVVVCSGSFASAADRFCWSLFRVDCIVGGEGEQGESQRIVVDCLQG